jgi:hypothetical protein
MHPMSPQERARKAQEANDRLAFKRRNPPPPCPICAKVRLHLQRAP